MDLLVKRTTLTSQSTIGELWMDGSFFCYTLEDMVRPDNVKIWGQTAIPHGRYEVIIRFSARFGRPMPALQNVPMFDGILIHPGNTAANTEGCILIGQTKAANFIGEARVAFGKFFPLLQAAVKTGKVFITIQNPADQGSPQPAGGDQQSGVTDASEGGGAGNDPGSGSDAAGSAGGNVSSATGANGATGAISDTSTTDTSDATTGSAAGTEDPTTGDLDIDEAGLQLIEGFEGLRLSPYQDPVGIWTVGYGHVIHPADNISLHQPITSERAEELLRQDLSTAENGVDSVVTVDLSDNQYAACVSLAFNIGAGNFARSTLVRLLNAGDVQRAADQFLVWNKAGGRVLAGLVKRREAERRLFLTPDSPSASTGDHPAPESALPTTE